MQLFSTPTFYYNISSFWISGIVYIITVFAILYVFISYTFGRRCAYIMYRFVRDINDQYIEHRNLLPFLITIFLFILFTNIIGIMGCPSILSNPTMMIILGIINLVVGVIYGIYLKGILGFLISLVPNGIPIFMMPLLFVIEFVTVILKPAIISIRLLLSIAIGHITLHSLANLLGQYGRILLVPLLLVDCIKAVLQSYIAITFLALFLGICTNKSH